MNRKELTEYLSAIKINRYKVVCDFVNCTLTISLKKNKSNITNIEITEFDAELLIKEFRKFRITVIFKPLKWWECRLNRRQVIMNTRILESGYRPTNKLDTSKPPK